LIAIPSPTALTLEDWLVRFPSYGFLLSVRPDCASLVESYFHSRQLVCEAIGTIQTDPKLLLKSLSQTEVFWDLQKHPLTGFALPKTLTKL
jgi:uncharacterized protein